MIRTVDTRIDVYRNGAKYSELCSVYSAEITMRSTDAIKTSMSVSFADDAGINFLTDELRPILSIDGKEYPCGVFLPATVTVRISDGSRMISAEAYDRCWRVQTERSEHRVYMAAGTRYIAKIKSLLRECGITAIAAVPSTKSTGIAHEWEPGEDYLTIINSLLAEINYKPLWFDAEGNAMLQPKTMPDKTSADHTYNDNDVKCMMLPEVNEQLDIFSLPNNFICICSSPDREEALVSVATNENPLSPISTVRRGRKISRKYIVRDIADQDALDEYAKILCNESMFLTETINITTALQSGHGVRDTIALTLNNSAGICVETGWRMQFRSGGNMQHTLEKVVFGIG